MATRHTISRIWFVSCVILALTACSSDDTTRSGATAAAGTSEIAAARPTPSQLPSPTIESATTTVVPPTVLRSAQAAVAPVTDTPVAISPAPEPRGPTGTFTVETTLRSPDPALAPIALEVRAVDVTSERLTFHLAFVNTSRQGYRVSGVEGGDAQLVGGEGEATTPVAVSPTLQGSITPEGGWQPAEAITGTITFSRPDQLQRVRFVFPFYNALQLDFNSSGLAGTEITSPAGGAPTPVATLEPAEEAFLEINRLLSRLAQAVEVGSDDAYIAAFAPALRAEQRMVLLRLQEVALASYELSVAPSADLAGAAGGTLEDVPIDVRYTLRGIPAGNQFLSTLRFAFQRVEETWQVTEVHLGEQPPFWRTGEIARAESEHFLIFTRPDLAEQLPALREEAEAAYQQLSRRGLPLKERYVAFVTATPEEFRQFTGQGDGVVGTALWRYQIVPDGFEVVSQAFYINGAAFRDQDRLPPGERQTTIAHELVHLALADETRPFTPAWLAEGIAVYFADQSSAAERRRLVEGGALDQLTLEQLTRASSLVAHASTGQQASDAYTFSGAAVAYLVEQHSQAKVLEFYRSFADVPPDKLRGTLSETEVRPDEQPPAVGDLSVQQTSEILQRLFGLTLAQLDAQVKQWLRTQ